MGPRFPRAAGPRRRQPGPARPGRAVAQLQPAPVGAVRPPAPRRRRAAARRRRRARHRRRRGPAHRAGRAVWLASGFYIVVEGTRGVVLTFGKLLAGNQCPACAGACRSRSSRTRSSTSRRCARSKSATATTCSTKVLQGIADAHRRREHRRPPVRGAVPAEGRARLLFNVRRPDESAMQIAETAMREVVGKSTMDCDPVRDRRSTSPTRRAI